MIQVFAMRKVYKWCCNGVGSGEESEGNDIVNDSVTGIWRYMSGCQAGT